MVMYLFTPIHNYLSNFKYIVLFTPFLIIVFVNIFVWWKNGFLTGILILFLFLYVGNAGYNQQVEHWKLLSDYLNKGDSKDVIIIGNSFARTALEYYYSGDMPVECAWEINGYSNCQSGIDSLAKYERIYYIKSWFGAKEIEPDIPYFSTNFILVGQETKIYSPASVWIFQNKNLNINPV